jgi:GMP synthase-like glutamine amidotransferase
MKVLVLQHLDIEHPGYFRDCFGQDGHSLHTVELDRGEEIPPLEPFDLMMVMGGPQDVWQEGLYPWLAQEKAAIKRFVMTLRRPMLGICLGHQLLAEAIGGKVGLGATPEVGIMPVDKTPTGVAHPLLAGLDDRFNVLQWHGAEVKALPSGAEILARSEHCAVQAFCYGDSAFGLQFHIEITGDTVPEWSAVPAYAAALEQVAGANAIAKLTADANAELGGLNANARRVYQNLMALLHEKNLIAS